MSDELARLRADLEALERVKGLVYFGEDFKVRFYERVKSIRAKIAELEAAADPWREARKVLGHWAATGAMTHITGLYDHLTAEVARLTARVAELEDVKPVADMQPPFEGPIVGVDPVLDPARVLATAVELGWGPTVYAEMTLLRDAKPYPLKKGGE